MLDEQRCETEQTEFKSALNRCYSAIQGDLPLGCKGGSASHVSKCDVQVRDRFTNTAQRCRSSGEQGVQSTTSGSSRLAPVRTAVTERTGNSTSGRGRGRPGPRLAAGGTTLRAAAGNSATRHRAATSPPAPAVPLPSLYPTARAGTPQGRPHARVRRRAAREPAVRESPSGASRGADRAP